MKKFYPSKKAKRRAEAAERKKKKIEAERNNPFSPLNEDKSIEEMAAMMGIRLD